MLFKKTKLPELIQRIQKVNFKSLYEGTSSSENLKLIRKQRRITKYSFLFLFSMLLSVILNSHYFFNPIGQYEIGEIAEHTLNNPFNLEMTPKDSEIAQSQAIKKIPPIFDYEELALPEWRDRWLSAIDKINKNKMTLSQLQKTVEESTKQNLSNKNAVFLMENKSSKILKETFAEISGELLDKMIAHNNLFPLYYQTGIFLKLKNSGSKEIFIRDVTRIWSIAQTKEFLFARFISQSKKQSLFRKKVLDLINAHIVPNIEYNENLTQKRISLIASKSSPTKLSLKKGELIIKRGDRVTENQYEIVKLIEKKYSLKSFVVHFINTTFFLFIVFSIFSRTNLTKNGFWSLSFKDSILFVSLLVFVVLFFQLLLPVIKNIFIQKYPLEYLVPIASTGVIIHLLMGKEAGMVFSFLQAILLGYYFDGNYPYSIWCLLVSLSSIQSIRSCKQRTDLYRCGLYSALIGMLTIATLSLWENPLYIETARLLLVCCFSLLSGLFSAAIASSLIPIFESIFGYTTNLKLLELSNFNHPLLHELMLKAPGTYHHSVMVGSLAEIAAEKIKANGLLARVAAYYHDIGKMHKPMYFIENQSPKNNPHDSLQPTMSAKILFSHVRDGAKLSKDHNLGQKITEIIEQHHGTTLVSYFLNKAKKIEDPNINPVLIEQFRYPGPKPQTKESAIVMLADACEASTRSISEPTPAKIQSMVHHIINKRFLDNQFSDCNLTMNELSEIEESFVRTLTSLYHHRIEYPGQSQNEEASIAKKA